MIFPGTQVRAEGRLNAVVLVAPPALLARVKAVIAALDTPPAAPAGPATEVVALRHADPVQIATLLAGVLPQVRVRVDPATRSLTLTGPPAVLAQAKAMLLSLDAPSPTAPTSEIVRVRAGDPEALARALRQAVPGLTVTPDRALSALWTCPGFVESQSLGRSGSKLWILPPPFERRGSKVALLSNGAVAALAQRMMRAGAACPMLCAACPMLCYGRQAEGCRERDHLPHRGINGRRL